MNYNANVVKFHSTILHKFALKISKFLILCMRRNKRQLACMKCQCENPMAAITYADIEYPHNTHFLLLDSISWIPCTCKILKLKEFELPDRFDIPNLFYDGWLSYVFHTFSGVYLKIGYEMDESGFCLPDQVYHLIDNHSCIQTAVSHLLRNHQALFKYLCDYLRSGEFPLTVLIHHVMLYQYYPKSLQEALWAAVEHYVNNSGEAYSTVQKLAVQKKIGNIRMYLVNPRDIFALGSTCNCIVVSSSNFQSYVQLRKPLLENNLPYEIDGFDKILQCANSEADIGWIAMIHCIGSNGYAFPIHLYLNMKKNIFLGKLPESTLLLYNSDGAIFKNPPSSKKECDFYNQLLLDLCKCRQFNAEMECNMKKLFNNPTGLHSLPNLPNFSEAGSAKSSNFCSSKDNCLTNRLTLNCLDTPSDENGEDIAIQLIIPAE
ncbi:UPF0300 family protein 1 [Schizosaccharomyces pombe]|uniref:Meiotically up-regulated gene 134 protein n=1 Tax=Schizosaccharomyces pombe (strain 972 / ATCC 24843) TaxID=284812 RepID=MU134_SCHPO|nr:uncharacterized protein SPAC10F6.15 [Schizosaccharomyces pombe]O42654.1 RecName: Full=Meiotically up-regulated gene 134 protein [Schizosaccharomyces pombe 972h-]CAA15728.1 S. pombe specific UPF0300 family protein 1 [Schizosaccharomyces pombe]|eukprot:NP_593266.1 uncharacterized protein SPAC10F6.15 [Schizosaccharomyces pombe]